MKSLIFILSASFIFFSFFSVYAEVLSFPPITYNQPFIENQPFSSLYGWFDFRHHAPEELELPPAWILDTGLIFTFYSWEYMAIEGMSRQIFLNQLHPDSYWIFWPLVIYTDLRLSYVVRVWKIISRISFQHDCKHDIEQYFDRVAIHESMGIHITHNPIVLWWPRNSFSSLFLGEVFSRIHFGPLFQNREIKEPDIFCFTLRGEVNPISMGSFFTLFLQGELNMFIRDPQSNILLSSDHAADWSIRTGIRFLKRENGITIYTELESLSDNWITNQPEASVLFSFGFLFYVGTVND